MKEVTKFQFYRYIYSLTIDVKPEIVNDKWPYIQEMRSDDGRLLGKIIEERVNGSALARHRYTVQNDAIIPESKKTQKQGTLDLQPPETVI